MSFHQTTRVGYRLGFAQTSFLLFSSSFTQARPGKRSARRIWPGDHLNLAYAVVSVRNLIDKMQFYEVSFKISLYIYIGIFVDYFICFGISWVFFVYSKKYG